MNGHFIISLDYELFWGLSGWNEVQLSSYRRNIENANKALRNIVLLLKKYDIKASIAFVGAMNNDSMKGYAEENKGYVPKYNDKKFAAINSVIPYVIKEKRYDWLFSSDMIDWLKTNSNIELATHTYSHFYCLEDGTNEDNFKEDLALIKKNAYDHSIELSTIIFPRNQVRNSFLEFSKQNGFTHFRGTLNTFLYKTDKTRNSFSIKGALRLLDSYINLSGYNDYFIKPVSNSTLINVPGSRFLRPYSKTLSLLDGLRKQRIKNSMKHAAKHGMIYHLWWHPHNFGVNMKENLLFLEDICKYYIELRDKYFFKSSFIKDM